MNTALLSKWWQHLFNDPNLYWNKLLRAIQYNRERPLHVRGKSLYAPLTVVASVLRCRDVFKYGASYKLGDGRDIRLWYDIWIGETPAPLSIPFPKLFNRLRNKDVRVSQCWNSTEWYWCFIYSRSAASLDAQVDIQFRQLKDLLEISSLTSSPDKVLWRWTSNLFFSVKSLYTFLSDTGMRDPLCHSIWHLHIPVKIKSSSGCFYERDFLPPIDCISVVS